MGPFSKGTAAMHDGDWERACRLFREASDLAPDNLMFRQTLRGCAVKMSERRRVTLVHNDGPDGNLIHLERHLSLLQRLPHKRFVQLHEIVVSEFFHQSLPNPVGDRGYQKGTELR